MSGGLGSMSGHKKYQVKSQNDESGDKKKTLGYETDECREIDPPRLWRIEGNSRLFALPSFVPHLFLLSFGEPFHHQCTCEWMHDVECKKAHEEKE